MSGNATVAQYQAALQSITFETFGDSRASRSLSITVFDGAATSNVVAETVDVSYAPPYVGTSESPNTFGIGGSPVVVDSELTVYSEDTDLTGATVTISPDTLQPQDTLNFTDQNGISGSYAGGVLTLTGTLRQPNTKPARQSVTFSTTSTNTTERSLSIIASDGALDSDPAPDFVDVAFPSQVVGKSVQTLFTGNGSTLGTLILDGSTLYGASDSSGTDDEGIVFSVNSDGTDYQILHSFTGTSSDGAYPYGGLTLVGSTLYGTTETGGSSNDGTVFSINTDGSGFHLLHSFTCTGTDGVNPFAGLTLVGSTLFGTTRGADGTIFSIGTDGSNYQVVHSFIGSDDGQDDDGTSPLGGFTLIGSTLFATTGEGGINDAGTIFSFDTTNNNFQVLHEFTGDEGVQPAASLTLVGSTLFGTTSAGGTSGNGTIFSLNSDGTGFQVVHSFSADDGGNLSAPLTLVGSTLFGTAASNGSDGDGTVFSLDTDGSNFQVLHAFTGVGSDGGIPFGGLTPIGSTLIGTTLEGEGSIFSISDASNYTVGGDPAPFDQDISVTLVPTTMNVDGEP